MSIVRKPPGRPAKHAGRALDRFIKQGKLDGRGGAAKGLKAYGDAIAADLGGWSNVSAMQAGVIREAARLAAICDTIGSWVLRQPSMIDGNGELLPVLAKSYATYSAALVRTLTALGLQRIDGPSQDLAAYLRAKSVGKPQQAASEPIEAELVPMPQPTLDDAAGGACDATAMPEGAGV